MSPHNGERPGGDTRGGSETTLMESVKLDRSRIRQATWAELDRSGLNIEHLAVGAIVRVHPDRPRPRPCRCCHRLHRRLRELADSIEVLT